MKNVNIVCIKGNFPRLKEKKKSFLYLKRNINPSLENITKTKFNNSMYIDNKSLIPNRNNSNNEKAIRLTKTKPVFHYFGQNDLLKRSASDFYITNLSSKIKRIKGKTYIEKKNLSLNSFKTQIISNNNSRQRLNYIPRIKKEDKKDEEDSPKVRFLGSLLKNKKKKIYTKKKKKIIIPQEQRKDYYEFIDRRRKLFFNPRATSQYVHEKNSDYLIFSIEKTKAYKLLQSNFNIKNQNQKEEILERRDIVPDLAYKTQNLLKQLRILFSEDFKFNYTRFNEDFYNNYENKVNFLYDIYRVPVFKNNLVKIILNRGDNNNFGHAEWKNINVINSTTWNYLNRLKTKMQREKDEHEQEQKELELKKKEEELGYFKEKKKKQKDKKIKNNDDNEESEEEEENDNNKKIIKEEENYKNIMKNVEKEEQLKQEKYEDLYIIEEYFLHSKNCDNFKVSIASERLRYLYFNHHDYKKIFN